MRTETQKELFELLHIAKRLWGKTEVGIRVTKLTNKLKEELKTK